MSLLSVTENKETGDMEGISHSPKKGLNDQRSTTSIKLGMPKADIGDSNPHLQWITSPVDGDYESLRSWGSGLEKNSSGCGRCSDGVS